MKRKQFLESIKGKAEAELAKMIAERHQKMEQLRFDLEAGKVKNSREMRQVKKERARLKTILNETKKTTAKTA